MKLYTVRVLISLLIVLGLVVSSLAAELDEHLQFLEPLLGKEWVGGYVGSESSDIEIVLLFEPILDGHAVKYIRNVEATEFSGLTQFYWNPGSGDVRFISLNNRGIVGEGVVSQEDGRIVLHGESYRQDQTTEFKTILAIDAKGTLRDTFLRMEDGEWVQGHLQEFIVNE